MRNNKSLVLLSISLLLVSCGSGKTSEGSSITSSDKSDTGLISGEFTDFTVTGYETRHTDIQLAYLDNKDYTNTDPYMGNMSKSAPNPIHFAWNFTGASNQFELLIAEDENFNSIVTTYGIDANNQFDFYNSELGKTYYAKVEALGNGRIRSPIISFLSQDRGPRNLFIEGVENVRDLGGWGYLKQGMIYRSGRFNEDKKEEVTPCISDSGIYEMREVLKIKTEIDLRKTSTNEVGGLTDTSVLGSDINYIQLPMCYNGNNILTYQGKVSGDTFIYDNPARIKDFFEILGDIDNYPLDFHCSIGKDRTGCLSYLINGLMGADEETLYRDYMFTNFANAGYCKISDIDKQYGKTLSEYEKGSSLQEKIYNYLNEVIGVSNETLDSVIEILAID